MLTPLFSGATPNATYESTELAMGRAIAEFWGNYYGAMATLHEDLGRPRHEPLRDRNLVTTNSKHVEVFEEFWAKELAQGLGVSQSDVTKRTVKLNDHRRKSVDVCYPKTGDPQILISVKTMQNAYRNMTNRVEEAMGDSFLLRLNEKPAAFGFFFFVLDGPVARGKAEIGEPIAKKVSKKAQGKKRKSFAPHLCGVEEGGDFFDLNQMAKYRRLKTTKLPSKGRQDNIAQIEKTLLMLASPKIETQATFLYDAIALVPGTLTRQQELWSASIAPVNPRLNYRDFIGKLIRAAQTRGLL